MFKVELNLNDDDLERLKVFLAEWDIPHIIQEYDTIWLVIIANSNNQNAIND